MMIAALVFLLLSSTQAFSCSFLITDIDRCVGASNGLRRFWERNENLKTLSQQQEHLDVQGKMLVRKSLKEHPDPLVQSVVRDFTKNKKKFYTELQSSIDFVEQHMEILKTKIGDVPAKNLYTRLLMLDNLISELYLRKPV